MIQRQMLPSAGDLAMKNQSQKPAFGAESPGAEILPPPVRCALCCAFLLCKIHWLMQGATASEFSFYYLKPCVSYFHFLHNGTIQEISRFFVGGGKDECAAHFFKSS